MDRALSRRPAGVLLLGIPVVLALAVFALWSLGPGDLDAAQVERDIAAEYEAREGVALELGCPADMPRESGGVFACQGTTAEGDSVYVEIQIADPEEDVDYHWWTPE